MRRARCARRARARGWAKANTQAKAKAKLGGAASSRRLRVRRLRDGARAPSRRRATTTTTRPRRWRRRRTAARAIRRRATTPPRTRAAGRGLVRTGGSRGVRVRVARARRGAAARGERPRAARGDAREERGAPEAPGPSRESAREESLGDADDARPEVDGGGARRRAARPNGADRAGSRADAGAPIAAERRREWSAPPRGERGTVYNRAAPFPKDGESSRTTRDRMQRARVVNPQSDLLEPPRASVGPIKRLRFILMAVI